VIAPDELTVFLGAGASLPEPASLPLFGDIARRILQQVGAPAIDDPTGPAPEILLRLVDQADFSPLDDLALVFASNTPNPVHEAVATLARSGSRIWTTNYDTLIEEAYSPQQSRTSVSAMRVATIESDLLSGPPEGRLHKPHGSLPDGPLIYSSLQVAVPIGALWREHLVGDLRGRHVALVGYRGADVDLFDALREGLSEATTLDWFVRPDDVDFIRWRFGLEPREPVDNPSQEFLDWLDQHTQDLPLPEQPAVVRQPMVDPRAFAKLSSDRFARARVASLCGNPRMALTSYAGDLLHHPVDHRTTATQVIGELTRTFPRARHALSAIAVKGPLRLVRRSNRLVGLSLTVASRDARFGDVRAILSRVALPDQPTALIDYLINLASASRMLGPADDAVTKADAALEVIRKTADDPDALAQIDVYRLGRAGLEAATNRRWLGAFDEAEDVLRHQYGILAGPRWTAWLEFERGCLALHRGQYRAATSFLDRANTLFVRERNWTGAQFSGLAIVSAARALGELPRAVESLNQARTLMRRKGTTRAVRAQCCFEIAEIRRAQHRAQQARRAYQATANSPFPVYQSLGALGLSALAADLGDEALERMRLHDALRYATDARCGVLAAIAIARGAQSTDATAWEDEFRPTARLASAMAAAVHTRTQAGIAFA
jgi:hypothetical protein